MWNTKFIFCGFRKLCLHFTGNIKIICYLVGSVGSVCNEPAAEKVVKNVTIFQDELRSSLHTKNDAPDANYNRQVLKFYEYILHSLF